MSVDTAPAVGGPGGLGRDTILEVANLEVVYHDTILALQGVSLNVQEGQITAVLGSNGAGKSTLMRAITGILRSLEGEVTKGRIEFDGHVLLDRDAAAIVSDGIRLVPEGRGLFDDLTVDENLRVGAHLIRDRALLAEGLDQMYTYFPKLAELRRRRAGYLSGGEQQMLAIGQALISQPKLLMLDEPSLGLAPLIVDHIFEVLGDLNRDQGLTVLLVEQSVAMALELADYAYFLQTGRVMLDGPADYLKTHDDVQEFYLGHSHGERRSFREIKTYRRRKRWL